MITKEQLKAIVPKIKEVNLDIYIPLLNELLPKYEINTNERLACFIAQLAHESGSFNYVKEIADGSAYEGRKDLGNIKPGDGKKYKGRGLIQITGYFNYKAVSKSFFGDERLLTNPEILEQPRYALQSALWYWKSRNLNKIADYDDKFIKIFKGKRYNKFEWLTLLINGGQNGIVERKLFYDRAKKVLNESEGNSNMRN